MTSSLPLGEKTVAILDREEIRHVFVRRLCPSIGLARSPFCRECVPQVEQFHICPAAIA